MAYQHIQFDDQTQHGRLLRRSLQQLEEGRDNLNDIIAAMQMMIDGDGSQAAHFTKATERFAFENDAAAKSAFDELNSLAFKLNTNSGQPNVLAAMDQAFNKFR